MEITATTKISELIKANSKSIEAIASLAKPLEKLKNPILRKIMASRVTIAEAAKMGGTTVEEFQRVLMPLGFSFKADCNPVAQKEAEILPMWLENAPQEDIDFYDVRSIIDNGADPLKEILGRFKTVPSGKILCIVNNFLPTPLIHLLKQEKAEGAFVEKVGDKEYRTYFLKKESTSSQSSEKKQVQMHDDITFDVIYKNFSPEQTRIIDVRALEMPAPLELILTELKTLPKDHALYVHHKRVPIYLLEELADKDYGIHILQKAEGDVKILIDRK